MASRPLDDTAPVVPVIPGASSPPRTRRPTLPDRYAPAVNEAALFSPASYTATTSSTRDPSPAPGPLSPQLSPAKAVAFLLRPQLVAARVRRHPLVLLVAGLAAFSLFVLAAKRGRTAGALGSPYAEDGFPSVLPWGNAPPAADEAAAAAAAAAPDEECTSSDDDAILDACMTTHLPNIPPKIWQIYLDFTPRTLTEGFVATWLARAPSHAYMLLDATGASSVVRRLGGLAKKEAAKTAEADKAAEDETSELDTDTTSTPDLTFARDAVRLYEAMPRRVLRADFLRYLVLALEGGVYSDFDTALVRPVREWVPAGLRAQTRLIVGLEADQNPPVKGTTYPVQFCQWTLASAAGHATMWTMVERILGDAAARKKGKEMTDDDVLGVTGPAAWTEVVYDHLNRVAGTGVGQPEITWRTLTGLREPRLFGDTLVLPIDGFATGVPHSHASRQTVAQTLVRHHFRGDWRNNNG